MVQVSAEIRTDITLEFGIFLVFGHSVFGRTVLFSEKEDFLPQSFGVAGWK